MRWREREREVLPKSKAEPNEGHPFLCSVNSTYSHLQESGDLAHDFIVLYRGIQLGVTPILFDKYKTL